MGFIRHKETNHGGMVEGTQGYTLAELLIAVAIIAILALLSVPSLFHIQANMRMLELDSAANQIALASQVQMTSMKVSGSWLGVLEKAGIAQGDEAQHARQVPNADDADDLYYVTADQAREAGILPRLSIDETVYMGDYIIEFSKSTASVRGVFYSDGRSGFFDNASASPGETPAEDYYMNMAAPSARNQEARRQANPMVGYFEGVPVGATDTIALSAPIIRADETGKLCVRNENLANASLNSSLKATITGIAADDSASAGQFVLSGIQVFGNSVAGYEITTQERIDEERRGIVIADGSGIDLMSYDGFQASDVFVIDLHVIKGLVMGSGDSFEDLATVLGSFNTGSSIKVDAEISVPQRPYIPTSSTGYLQWPEKRASLTLMVADPSALRSGDSYSQTHIDPRRFEIPQVSIVFTSGEKGTGFARKILEEASVFNAIPSTPQGLKQANPASAYQAYSGGTLLLGDIDASMESLEATLGGYYGHGYHASEIWLGGIRVGYLKNEVWEWTGGIGQAFKACVTGFGTGGDPSIVESLSIDLAAFTEFIEVQGIEPIDGDYTISIRTTPRASEVRDYFSLQIGDGASSLHALSSEGIGSRSSGNSRAAAIRNGFESEFGVPSSMVSWAVVRGADSSGIEGFPVESADFRVYYAGTPALGFYDYDPSTFKDAEGKNVLGYGTSQLSSAVLWYYEYDYPSYGMHPQATVRDPLRAGYNPFFLEAGEKGDFGIVTTRDHLFYRALFYFDDAGNRIGAPQYVPYASQDVAGVATIRNRPEDKPNATFTWATESTYPTSYRLLPEEGEAVGLYDEQLAYGRVDLMAEYTLPESKIGLIYYERYDDGSYGCFGHTTAYSPLVNTLAGNERNIVDWGYRVVVESSETLVPRQDTDGERVLESANRKLIIDGIEYASYYPFAPDYLRNESMVDTEFFFKAGNVKSSSSRYSFNLNFACMVEPGRATVAQWGTDPYPFCVRSKDHFVGCEPTKWVQSNYVKFSFRQTHSIDLEGMTVAYGSSAFEGTYDGGSDLGCVIKNYHPVLATYSGGNYGLFGLVDGGELRNITLDYSTYADSYYLDFAGSDYFSFGFLAASARGGSLISNCVVTGLKEDGFPLWVYFTTVSWGSTVIGGLVGSVDDSIIEDCRVSGLDLTVLTIIENWGSSPLNIGGLVGQISGGGSEILRTEPEAAASECHIYGATKQSLANATLSFGAIVGAKGADATKVVLDDSWFESMEIERFIDERPFFFVEAIGRIPTDADE